MRAVNLVVLACVLRAATKKGRQLYRGKKCTTEKILATLMGGNDFNPFVSPKATFGPTGPTLAHYPYH